MKLRVVSARTGMLWVRLGMKAFFKQPLALVGLFLLFMACVSVLSIVPVLGNVLALALLPAATLGLIEASRMAADGKFPMPRVLASALTAGKSTRQAMLVLGGWYAVAFLGVMAVSALVDGGDFARLYLVGGSLDQKAAEAALAEGRADATVFGGAFLANPDLPERFRQSAALNTPDKNTFYAPGAAGYTDYPFLSGTTA